MANVLAAFLEVCSYCGADDGIKLRCAQCKKTWYCTPQHQKLHWKYHKPDCIAEKNNQENQKIAEKQNEEISAVQSMEDMSVGSVKHNYRNSSLGLAEYEMNPSPAVNSGQASVAQRAEFVVKQLYTLGVCIIDEFLGSARASKVLYDTMKLVNSGTMKTGQLVQADNKANVQTHIRGDRIAWLTGTEEPYENMNLIIQAVDQLIRHCNIRILDHNIKGRTPAMVACYPGTGTGYKRHVDNMTKDGRCITCLYYLNKGWDSECDGGKLRIYKDNKQIDIDPLFDRLLIFWSDSRTPHEVLPAYRERLAVTLWYFDGDEREKVKDAYLAKVKTSFSAASQKAKPSKTSATESTPPKVRVQEKSDDKDKAESA